MMKPSTLVPGATLAILTAAMMLAACAPETGAKQENSPALSSVEGSVSSSQSVELPADANLTVQLLDVSKQDVAADVISETTKAVKSLPSDYSLTYDPSKLLPNMRYSLRAQVMAGGVLAYTTTEFIPVTGSETRIDLTVSKVGGEAAPNPPAPNAALLGAWQAAKISGITDLKPGAGIEFAADGTVSGGSGCNGFRGKVTLTGDNGLEFGPLASTRKACPPDLMEQESSYFKALAAARTWRVDSASGSMELMDESGQVVAAFSKA